MSAEPYLDLPVTLSNGQYSRRVAITGKPPETDLSRVLDLDLEPVAPARVRPRARRPAGLASSMSAPATSYGSISSTGERRTVEAPVTQVIQSYLGLMVYMDIDALARLSGTGPRISGAHLAIDAARLDDLYAAVKETPEVASVALQSIARLRFQETMQENILIMITVYFTLAVIIAFGVVYNSARIQLSERARELATLRVLGFGRGEVSKVLFIETGVDRRRSPSRSAGLRDRDRLLRHAEHRQRPVPRALRDRAGHLRHREPGGGRRGAGLGPHRPPPRRPARSRARPQDPGMTDGAQMAETHRWLLSSSSPSSAGLVYALRPQPVAVDLATLDRGPMEVTVDEEGIARIRDVFRGLGADHRPGRAPAGAMSGTRSSRTGRWSHRSTPVQTRLPRRAHPPRAAGGGRCRQGGGRACRGPGRSAQRPMSG